MAKQRTRVLRARKSDASRDDDTLLIRSAESLGRVIGSLQRQVQGSAKRMSTTAEDAMEALPDMPRMGDVIEGARAMVGQGSARASGARKTSGARKSSGARETSAASKNSGARKASATKRAGQRKSGGARKSSSARKRGGGN